VCRGGDEVDFWVFAGVPAGVPPVVLGGLCTSFIRRAYLHTTSSVLVRRATVGVGNLGLCVCLPCCPSVSVCTLCARRAHTVCVPHRSGRGALFVACVFCMTGMVGVFTLPTRVTQPSFFPDVLYVDDILIACDQLNSVGAAVKQQLKERYKMKDLGRVRRFLGIEVDENFNISQTSYIEAILRRFRMENAKSATSPMDPNVRLDNPRCDDKEAPKTLYLSMVGSLMYAALGTRPDLAFCVTSLSRYNSRPLAMHLTAAKRALRYLKSTANLKVHYDVATPSDESSTVTGFTDSDWAGNLATRKSVGGCIFSIGSSGSIHWHSKSQSVVALSTLEAEYIACSNATREALWLQRLEADFTLALIKGKSHSTPVKIGCDNQGALKLLETGVIQAKTKHIDVKYHHTRDEIAKGKVAFSYVASAENPADILTKALNAHKHNYILDKLYLKC
jgi:hypothetical protein